MRVAMFRANETLSGWYSEYRVKVSEVNGDMVSEEIWEHQQYFRYHEKDQQSIKSQLQSVMVGFELKTGTKYITSSSQLPFTTKSQVLLQGYDKPFTIVQSGEYPIQNAIGGTRGQKLIKESYVVLT